MLPSLAEYYHLSSFLLLSFHELSSRNLARTLLFLIIITPITSPLFSENFLSTATQSSRRIETTPLYNNSYINLSGFEFLNGSCRNNSRSYTFPDSLKSIRKPERHYFGHLKQDKLHDNYSVSTPFTVYGIQEKKGIENRIPSSMDKKLDLAILGLFELTQGTETRSEGPSEVQAAKLAIDQINAMDILPTIHLRLIYNDTQCDPGVAVDRFFHAVYTSMKNTLMPFLLGTACSEVTETLARIVPYWNIVQISHGSTSPTLSHESEFPLFIRTVAPDTSHNPARIALIKNFGWDTVIALSQNSDKYSLAINDLVTELEQANITCTATITFGDNDYKEQLKKLKELDTRIIFGSFSSKLASLVLCEAWKLDMYGDDYVWILPDETIDLSGMNGDRWHALGTDNCLKSQFIQTLNGLIIVKSYGTVSNDDIKSSSGLTSTEFSSELTKRGVTSSRFAATSYDAIWSMGLVISNLEEYLNEHNSSFSEYKNSKELAYRLITELKNLNFLGVSGPVSFNGADRVGITALYQMQGNTVKQIALYTPGDGHLVLKCPGCTKFRWPSGQPPVARRVFRIRMVTIDSTAFFVVVCLASIGIILALSFLIFNLYFRRHKSIKISSPRLNNMAALGSVLVYGAVILLGLDHATLYNHYYSKICTARAYLLSAGFSLAFGSMFTKTYRVHRIFTRNRSGIVKNKLLQDTQLISLICLLLLIDGFIVTLWITIDPMERFLRNLTLEINPYERGVVYQLQVEICNSHYTNRWLALLYTYKGLLLLVGVYMAWETRHVNIPALNDSHYIGMSVYSVVISSGIIVVLANLLSDQVTLAFVIIAALILSSTTATLGLIFLPQLSNILGNQGSDPVVLHGLGLKFECNTRRFANDDKREQQYRVQVQNRVYQREVAQLESQLAKLEKLLSQESFHPSHESVWSPKIPQRNLSISGGLPLLLLSVLPPVIPRASWPSTDFTAIRRGTVAFSSQPELEWHGPRCSFPDIYKIQTKRSTEGSNRLSVLKRIINLFDNNTDKRKISAASFAGVTTTLKAHMGYATGLGPTKKATSTLYMSNSKELHSPNLRYGSGPIIHITREEDRRTSLGMCRKEYSESKGNFCVSPSTDIENTLRDRIFPNRVMPANSLGTVIIDDKEHIKLTSHRWRSLTDDVFPIEKMTNPQYRNAENIENNEISTCEPQRNLCRRQR